jgi:Leucine-rich repeat (LRR) protein
LTKKNIFIGYEHLSNLSETIEGLIEMKTLEHLTIWVGGMTFLPDALSRLQQVRILHILSGSFGMIPSPILKMENLCSLSLRNDKIDCINGISNLKKLRFLDLGQNKISHITEEIGKLENTKKLYLDDNPIISISPAIYNLKKLEYLGIDRATITSLTLEDLPKSTIVDIDDLEEDSFGW